jgi:hypothetical protein
MQFKVIFIIVWKSLMGAILPDDSDFLQGKNHDLFTSENFETGTFQNPNSSYNKDLTDFRKATCQV